MTTGERSLSDLILFWASFFTLIAAGMGFAIRGDIIGDWGRQFGFTQTELGEITGQGLAGFGLTIILFQFPLLRLLRPYDLNLRIQAGMALFVAGFLAYSFLPVGARGRPRCPGGCRW